MCLLLIDGHYYLYRSYFAIRGLTNSRGEPTNAIYGFLKALRKMVADLKPELGAVVWDNGLPDRRTALQSAYKQHRPEMPPDMRSQEAWLQENVPLTGFASLSVPNTEADDLIASYARKGVQSGYEIVIATNDKDILQLTSERVAIYSTAKADAGTSGFALLGPKQVKEKWGVEPGQIAEILALTGDSTDNIPGVPGVGGALARSAGGSAGGLRGRHLLRLAAGGVTITPSPRRSGGASGREGRVARQARLPPPRRSA